MPIEHGCLEDGHFCDAAGNGVAGMSATGNALVIRPRKTWKLTKFPVQQDGSFGCEALQAMVGGTFDYLGLGHGMAVVFDDDGRAKRLPPCVAFGKRGQRLLQLLGPVAIVRTTSDRMLPVRDVELAGLFGNFDWVVA